MESSTDMRSGRDGEGVRRTAAPGGGNAAPLSGAGRGPAAVRAAPRPQGAYTAAVVDGTLAFTAGMTPRVDGTLTVRGRVGAELDLPAAREAAGIAARNAVTALVAALGDPGRLRRFLRMTVYVACTDGFHELSAVADGASQGLVAAYGEMVAGDGELVVGDGDGTGPAAPGPGVPAVPLPVRSALGVRTLPQHAPVEVELTAAVRAEP